MTKKEKYQNGYQAKLDYYQDQAMQAMAAGDQEYVKYFMGKLTYFMERQAVWLYNQQMLKQLKQF